MTKRRHLLFNDSFINRLDSNVVDNISLNEIPFVKSTKQTVSESL